jgi:hypothetical protein
VLFFSRTSTQLPEGAQVSRDSIVAEVKQEITRLQQVLVLLGDSKKTSTSVASNNGGNPRRTLSASARKRISAAQRARWAKVRAAKK